MLQTITTTKKISFLKINCRFHLEESFESLLTWLANILSNYYKNNNNKSYHLQFYKHIHTHIHTHIHKFMFTNIIISIQCL